MSNHSNVQYTKVQSNASSYDVRLIHRRELHPKFFYPRQNLIGYENLPNNEPNVFADIKYRSRISTSFSESSSASLPSLSTSAQQSATHVSSMASNFPRSHCTGNSIISSSVASSTALSRILVRVTIASISSIPSHRHSCKQYHTKHFPCNHDSSYQ
jgi:hypothetical protein